MRNYIKIITPIFLAILIGTLTLLFAQSERGNAGKNPRYAKGENGAPLPPGGRFANGFPPELAERLNLTDEQKEQIKNLHEKAQADSKDYFEKIKNADEQLRAIVKEGNFDEPQAREIIGTKTQAMTELEIIHLRTGAGVNGILTADQKAKLEEMRANRPEPPNGGERFGKNFRNEDRPNMPPPPPPQN